MTQQFHSQAHTLRKPKIVKDICIPWLIPALFTIAKTWKQPRCPLTYEWIKKQWYIYTIEYYSAIKRNVNSESVLMRWMNLEPIIQSEVSQKEKDRYHILTHIYINQKKGAEEFIYKAAIGKKTQKIDLWTWERGEEDETYGKSNMETYITMCKIDSQQEFALSAFTFTHWRRKWQPTPVLLPGESQVAGSLVGCHLWGRTGSDTTEANQQQQGLPRWLSGKRIHLPIQQTWL